MNHVRGPIHQTQTFTTELKSIVQQDQIDLDYNLYFRTESKIKKLTPGEVIQCYSLSKYIPKLVDETPEQELKVKEISTYFDLTYQKSRKLVVLELESLLQSIIRGSKNWPITASTLVYALHDYTNGKYKYDDFRLYPSSVNFDDNVNLPPIFEDLVTEIQNSIFKTVFDTSNYELIQQFLIKQVFGQEYQEVDLQLNKRFKDNNTLDGIDYYAIERQLTNLPTAYSIFLQDGPTLDILKLITIQYLVRLGDQVIDDENSTIVKIPSVKQGKSTYNERYGIPPIISFHTGLVLVWLWSTLYND